MMQPAVVAPVPVAAPPEINFHNRAAVRIGFLSAGLVSFANLLPLPPPGVILWLLVWLFAGGFFSVYLYRRRTGQVVSIRGGARMGWITGTFCFAIATVLFTISMLVISTRGGVADFFHKQLAMQRADDANIRQFVEVLQNPAGLATIILLSLLFLFVFFTMVSTVGGAFGAKVLTKD